MSMLASSRAEARVLPRLAQVPKCLAVQQSHARRVRWASTNGTSAIGLDRQNFPKRLST